jgi:hypothetical protein
MSTPQLEVPSSNAPTPGETSEATGQGHGKHPVQSSKGVANQDTGPEEAVEMAKERAEAEEKEQIAEQERKAAEPEADINLVTAGVSIDPVEYQASLEEVSQESSCPTMACHVLRPPCHFAGAASKA